MVPIEDVAPEDLLEIALRNDQDRPVWKTAVTVADARRRSADGRMVLVAIPAGKLREGRWVLRVGPSGAAEQAEIAFEVVNG